MMGGFAMSGSGVLWYLVLAALVVVPFWKILPRHGLQPWFALLALIPIGAIILLWIVAFKDDSISKTDGA